MNADLIFNAPNRRESESCSSAHQSQRQQYVEFDHDSYAGLCICLKQKPLMRDNCIQYENIYMCDIETQYELNNDQVADVAPNIFCRSASTERSSVLVVEMDFTDSDISYVLECNMTDSSFLQLQSQSELSQETVESDICYERKFLVCKGMLNLLFRFCLKCGSPLSEFRKFVTGSMLGIQYTCNNNCSDTWRS